MKICPRCSSEIFDLGGGGETICTNCGLVLDENPIVNTLEFNDNGGGSSLVGQIVSETGSSSFSSASGRYKESREVTLANGRKRISQIASGLNIQQLVEIAHKIFALAVNKNFTQGRKASYVCAACLYVACRLFKNPTMLVDFADLLQVDVWSLGSVYMKLNTELKYIISQRSTNSLKVKPIDPSLYIRRFASLMEFGDQEQAVALTALRLTKRMQRDWITRGRRPLGIVAASLLLAARIHGTKKDVLSIIKVSDETLRVRLSEFESTAASSLTIDEFNKLAEQTGDFAVSERGEAIGDDGIMSSHPPAFVRNRMKDEQKSQMLAIGSIDNKQIEDSLVSNGIITPGSHMQKQKKASKSNLMKQQELDELYRDLEQEMQSVLTEMNSTEYGELQIPNHETDTTITPLTLPAEDISLGENDMMPPPTNSMQNETSVDMTHAYDSEVEEMLLTEEEQAKKLELWEAANGDWVKNQEIRRKEREEQGTHVTKRKKKLANKSQYRHPVKTAAEGLRRLVETKKVSKNVNYDAMKSLFN